MDCPLSMGSLLILQQHDQEDQDEHSVSWSGGEGEGGAEINEKEK
jgi:hypothetical protein